MKRTPSSPDYTVGYGKPPEHTRFKKGISGNPNGRPKGTLNLVTVLNKALNEKVTIVEHGKRRSITKLEAAFKQLVNKAAQGDPRALQQLLSLGSLIGLEPPAALSVLDDDETAVLAQVLQRFTPSTPAAQENPDVPTADPD